MKERKELLRVTGNGKRVPVLIHTVGVDNHTRSIAFVGMDDCKKQSDESLLCTVYGPNVSTDYLLRATVVGGLPHEDDIVMWCITSVPDVSYGDHGKKLTPMVKNVNSNNDIITQVKYFS